MGAPKGNKFWQQRSSHGRNPLFEEPSDLWDAACEYFEWCEENPIEEGKLVSYEGVSTVETLPKMRAMTEKGLRIFLGISHSAWYDYAEKDGFSDIVKEIKDIIFTQKFEGSAAGLLNSNIIARDLGLTDKKESTVKADVLATEMTPEQRSQRIKELQDQLKRSEDV